MQPDTQVVLAIIAIITVLIGLISTILIGVGGAAFFIVKYFIQEVKDLRDLWRKDQATWAGLMGAFAEPIKEIVRMTGGNTDTLKTLLDLLEEQDKNSKESLRILAAFATRNRKQQGG